MESRILLFVFSLFLMDVVGQIGFEERIVIDNTATIDAPAAVFAADINGDGFMDILSASVADSKIAWYENIDGLGIFSQKIITNNLPGATAVFAADLDGDGDQDVLASSNFNNRVEWYENLDGQGEFGAPQLVTNNAQGASSVFASDIDGDGDIDILSGSKTDKKVAWYENIDGQGNFSSPNIISLDADEVESIYVSDIDGDGDMDVLSSPAIGKIAWYENEDGQGNFGSPKTIRDFTSGHSIIATDIDGDNDMDVFVTSKSSNIIFWFRNEDGLGNYSDPITINNNSQVASSVFADDLDGDGDMDILEASFGNDRISWYENIDGQGNFNPFEIITTDADGANSVFATDIDNDGDADVISSSFSDDKIAWYENEDGLGTFGSQQVILPIADDVISVDVGDLDGDGDLDLVAAAANDDKVLWYENLDGLGNYGVPQNIPANSNVFVPNSVKVADIDDDGDMDIVCIFFASSIILWYENVDGLGQFNSHIVTEEIIGGKDVFVIDIDGDGDQDIISSSSSFVPPLGDDKIAWYENMDGQGNFGTQQIISTNANQASKISAVDFDGDGDIDILSSSNGNGEVVWYENMDGQGDFGLEKFIGVGVGNDTANSFATDIDGDGDMDVIANFSFSGKHVWYENVDGLGNFSSENLIATVSSGKVISAEDLDNDGDMDVISGTSSLFWFENIDGQGSFGIQQDIISSFDELRDLTTADIDNDGDMDIISASTFDKKISWFENKSIVSNEIRGTVRLDLDANGCDVNDEAISNVRINTDNGIDSLSVFSLANGFYQLFPEEGDYFTSLNMPSYFDVTPPIQESNFIGIGTTEVVDFCLSPNEVINDLNISLLPLIDAKPGFDVSYQLVYHNVGTTQLDGNVMLEFDDTKLSFLIASETIAAQTNNSITFDYVGLSPFETRVIDLDFNVLPPPTVNIDEYLYFVSTINPIAGDADEYDNVLGYYHQVVGSYDPNDIRVLEGDQVLIEDADKYLHYIIRFQNTGTASAINVRVENILDDNLDWQTMQLESSSHSNRVEIQDGNQVAFIFDGIYLADSTSNEPESHGFIAYKIKPKSDIQVGDMISSTADIYFDFNEAVVTNTVTTTIVETVSIDENTLLGFSIYPIPTSGILTIQSEFNIVQIEIFDRLGQLLLSNFNKKEIDLSSLNRGFYFCKIKDEDGNAGIKKVVKE